jgi:hypothetical protein
VRIALSFYVQLALDGHVPFAHIRHMTRTELLLDTLGIDQQALADHLRCSRSVVSRLKTGVTPDDGPVSKLLDQIEQAIVTLGPKAAREWVLSGAISTETLAEGLAAEAMYEAMKRAAARDAKAPAERPAHIMQSGFGSFS